MSKKPLIDPYTHKLHSALGAFNDNGMLRVNEMYPLLLGDPSDGLQEALEDILSEPKSWKRLFNQDFKYIVEADEDDMQYDSDREKVRQMLEDITYRHEGKFLVRVSTPVRQGFTGKGSCHFSWGYTTLTWIVATDLPDAITQGLAWSEEMEKQDRKEDRKSKKTSKKTSKKKGKK
jgi:hypothetical protein